MIEQRLLIQNIPAGKFHSVLMTSFSINLYYWEIQLLRTLSGKGINFVSAIVDSDCLSDQLLKFSKAFSGKRHLEFSLHGYKSKGAFHPKIQFYAGNDNILVLIGSGNLTISGHGKNMEVWTPVMVDSTGSSAYPFVRDVWNYLSSLYNELGDEAYNIIKSVEDNCSLLQVEYTSSNAEHQIDSDYSIRLFVDGSKTLFDQCSDWIGEETINSITVMSPFYDSRAELVKALYERYNPGRINIIIEQGLGAPPKSQSIPDYVNIYSWDKAVPEGKQWQKFFHSKCFFFEGETNNYLLCGSANASVAAFGIPGVPSTNREASVGNKSATTDYLAESGIRLIEPICASDVKENPSQQETKNSASPIVWIKEASYEYDHFVVKTQNDIEIQGAKITFYCGNRLKYESFGYSSSVGEFTLEGLFKDSFNPLYVEITNHEDCLISNRQFVIPTVSMDYNNPSPCSTSYRKGCRAIESGKFVNGSVLRFIEQILSDTESKISAKSIVDKSADKTTKEIKGGQFSSFEDYIKDDGTGITGDPRSRKSSTSISQSTLLFDSIMSYIAKSAKEKEEEDINNEETEDIKKSEGRETTSRPTHFVFKPKSVVDVKKRVAKMLSKYIEQLEAIAIYESKPSTISMIETLKKFMTAIFFVNRTLSYRYVTEDDPEETQSLLDIPYSVYYHKTATEFVYRIINLFSLYLQKCNIQEETNKVLKAKVENYKQYAFELCLSVISVCEWLNEGNEHYNVVKYTQETTLRNIQSALDGKINANSVTEIFRRYDKSIQDIEGFARSHMEGIIGKILSILANPVQTYPNGNIVFTNEFGYVALLPHPRQNKTAFPCTMASEFDKERKIHCPEYMYMFESNRMIRRVPKVKC